MFTANEKKALQQLIEDVKNKPDYQFSFTFERNKVTIADANEVQGIFKDPVTLPIGAFAKFHKEFGEYCSDNVIGIGSFYGNCNDYAFLYAVLRGAQHSDVARTYKFDFYGQQMLTITHDFLKWYIEFPRFAMQDFIEQLNKFVWDLEIPGIKKYIDIALADNFDEAFQSMDWFTNWFDWYFKDREKPWGNSLYYEVIIDFLDDYSKDELTLLDNLNLAWDYYTKHHDDY